LELSAFDKLAISEHKKPVAAKEESKTKSLYKSKENIKNKPKIDDDNLKQILDKLNVNKNLIINKKYRELHNLKVMESPNKNRLCTCTKAVRLPYRNCC